MCFIKSRSELWKVYELEKKAWFEAFSVEFLFFSSGLVEAVA